MGRAACIRKQLVGIKTNKKLPFCAPTLTPNHYINKSLYYTNDVEYSERCDYSCQPVFPAF